MRSSGSDAPFPDALQAAQEIAAALNGAASLAIRSAKVALHAQRLPPNEARQVVADVFSRLWFTADHRDAERAIVEKREAVFHGR